ncbi:asparagine synthase-related protein [Mumia sp. DW29H23]|uniref:asparagine synthase-related protein n=1 Tax=Mumia sp. DW29H23 TaxID=3421241 RepID=UPI003D683CE2
MTSFVPDRPPSVEPLAPERLDPLETAIAMPRGRSARAGHAHPAGSAGPREVLEGLLTEVLGRGRCFVLFSGGRDSSALLAVATAVARRTGADDPVPVIGRYPREQHPDAYEEPWQDLVLDHLGIGERIVLDLDDDVRVLGARARGALLRHGALWPASVQSQEPFFSPLPDGARLLTGEGGDQAFLPRRITPLALLLKHHRRPDRALLGEIAASLAPAARQVRRQPPPSWLRGEAVEAHRDAWTAFVREPWGWDRQTRRMYTSRAETVPLVNLASSAAEHGVALSHPFTDRGFLDALASAGGRWGYAGRTDVMRRLFSDVLPDAVLSRRTKAWFNSARWGEEERAFAERWTGSGIDPRYVDAEALRAQWLEPRQNQATYHLLQVAWVAAQRGDRRPAGDGGEER